MPFVIQLLCIKIHMWGFPYEEKIIIIFSALIIAFALVIVGAKTYGFIKEKSREKDKPIQTLNRPSITVEKTEGVCTLTVSYDEGLDKVTYSWNDEDIIVKNMNGSTTPFITQIVIPEGDYNVLHVKATGVDGSNHEINQEFAINDIQDPNKPKISWFYNAETRKIDIVVESEKGIEKLTYQWEGEDEVTVENTEENQKELRVTIDAKRGTNKIYITATDLEGNTQIKDEIIQGIFKPEHKIQLINNRTLFVEVKHDMGFKKVVINVNGQELVYDENHPQYNKETTSIDTSIDLDPGIVTVKLSIYTLEEEEKEYTYEASTEILE